MPANLDTGYAGQFSLWNMQARETDKTSTGFLFYRPQAPTSLCYQ
jgi:hypothetical protein